MHPVAQELRVIRETPRRRPVVLHVVGESPMAYWPRLNVKVLVTVSPCPSLQVSGTRSSSEPSLITNESCAAVHNARCVGADSPGVPVRPVCRRYKESSESWFSSRTGTFGVSLCSGILDDVGAVQFAALQLDRPGRARRSPHAATGPLSCAHPRSAAVGAMSAAAGAPAAAPPGASTGGVAAPGGRVWPFGTESPSDVRRCRGSRPPAAGVDERSG